MLAPLVFDSELLGAIVEALEARSKAIRYKAALELTREIDHTGEQLSIHFRSDGRVHMCIWPDGRFWLGITKPRAGRAGGWEVNEQFHGRLGEIHPVDVVAKLESTLTFHAHPDEILRVWHDQHLTRRFS